MRTSFRLAAAIVLCACCVGASNAASAQVGSRVAVGPHLGMNFDINDAFLGVEGRIDIARLGRSALLQVNPSASYYFTDNVDLFNFSFNLPFEFMIRDSVLRPMAAVGLGIFHLDYETGSDTNVMLNLIGGFAFDLRDVVPFIQLRAAIGDGSVAELMGGLVVVL
jgi:hypothetical protein